MNVRAGSLAMVALLGACAPPPAAPRAATPKIAAPIDRCKGAPPLPRPHAGILRAARCDAEALAIMDTISADLGLGCQGCHAPLAADPTKQDFSAPTPRKAIANWMSAHLSTAVKHADGAPIACRSCHVDNLGRPLLKVLGTPRDRGRANEQMSLVMVRRFVAADGSRLKCRSCHGGTPGTPAFRGAVIGHDEALPARTPGGAARR